MKLKYCLLASALFSLTSLSVQAAQELTPQQAASLKPFERIAFTGRFNAIGDAVSEASRRADEKGAASFYVLSSSDTNGNGGNWRVVADLYRADAAPADTATHYRTFEGVRELPKKEAIQLEPYDTVSVSGFYRSQPDVNTAIAKAAKDKGAAAFYIVRQVDANNGGNQYITAYVYKADAPKRVIQKEDAVIPADSEAGKAALAAGGAAAARVEIPGVASSSSPSREVGRFFETQSSTGKRYTVTTMDGSKVQELNNTAAALMQPFDSVTFTGHFGSPTEVSEQVAKRAAAKGAKFYHITRQWQNQSGGNLTVSADLFK
ncbi:DUF1471 family protein YdgH [Pantoea sp. 1.19]|uniref:DUF1471 family protein YdgH n=1 Tax=Pantoea sp. 1.19 TaxID=1925589 RepID=UPI000948A093|nr:DUF1471 family protein YdgH [Pantoea sp. 1.19]